MIIASIDVGIKNLAICILSVELDSFKILYWDVINLFEEKNMICSQKNLSKKIECKCNNKAKFFKNNENFCKNHANKSNYKIPTSKLLKYKRLKLDELLELVKEYDMDFIGNENKKSLTNHIEKFIHENVFEYVNQELASEMSLLEISISIKKNLIFHLNDYLEKIDVILIENQIGPLANKMCSIQGMLTQFFVLNNISNIQFISAINKLKNFIKQKTSYHERKKISIEITKNLLNNLNIEQDVFCKHLKRDDLADCFLQAIWYIQENKINNLILNINSENLIKF